MPPYKPAVSKAQERKLFALANEGRISMADARGKARAAEGKKLPEHVKHGAIRQHMQTLGSYGDMSHARVHPGKNLGHHLRPRKAR